MPSYIVLMHADTTSPVDEMSWTSYIAKLAATGRFMGGSAIGAGTCVRRSGPVPDISAQVTGFIRIEAEDIDAAQRMMDGNPVYEAGGTVEIRDLPRTG